MAVTGGETNKIQKETAGTKKVLASPPPVLVPPTVQPSVIPLWMREKDRNVDRTGIGIDPGMIEAANNLRSYVSNLNKQLQPSWFQGNKLQQLNQPKQPDQYFLAPGWSKDRTSLMNAATDAVSNQSYEETGLAKFLRGLGLNVPKLKTKGDSLYNIIKPLYNANMYGTRLNAEGKLEGLGTQNPKFSPKPPGYGYKGLPPLDITTPEPEPDLGTGGGYTYGDGGGYSYGGGGGSGYASWINNLTSWNIE
jgi:hypothetical protein